MKFDILDGAYFNLSKSFKFLLVNLYELPNIKTNNLGNQLWGRWLK